MEHSLIQWIQIPAKNLARAAKFYEDVFDAAFFFEELNHLPHAVFKANKNGKKVLNGTLVETTKNIGWGAVLFFEATGNFEMIMQLIEENGGKITTPKTLITRKDSENEYTIPNTYIDNKPGYYAHFEDSEGNKMGLYGSN
jgi:predicted enzyme related to lactoylglutathione lyase